MLRFFSTFSVLAALGLVGCGGNNPQPIVTGPVKATPASNMYAIQNNVLAGTPTPVLSARDLIVKIPADEAGIAHDTTIAGPAGVSMSGIAVDTSGNLYTVGFDWNNGAAEVLIYAKDAASGDFPVRTIRGANTLLSVPQAITVDRRGNIYVLDWSNGVLEFSANASGDVAPMRHIGDGGNVPSSIAVNSKGELFVADMTSNVGITVYTELQSGDVPPARVIRGSNTGLAQTYNFIAFDKDDHLFVTSFGSVQAGGRSSGLVLEFAADASGNATPFRTISGVKAGTNIGFFGIAVDPVGTVFLQEVFPDQSTKIVTYNSSATGEADVRTSPIVGDLVRSARGLAAF